ncbi:MAG: anthranilate synthase component I [Nitrospinaceae bacterium]|nr:anthranilate synthase component I [Nitrospina sp.]MBT5867952.1 anthranilate synthase component I [Nitrospinaceae bacterium]MBT6347385.1 anthranilate synthase component I [Nitrospina sp.]
MFSPSLEEFKQKAKSGNLIPVYKEILADLDTPVSAYMKISDGEYSFLLESIEGGEKWARYCFLGCDPSIIVSTKGLHLTLIENGKREEREISSGSPLSAVKEILARYQPVPCAGLPRFSGGAVGFVSYDMVRFFEELPEETIDDLDVPDSQFVITDTMLVFDNVSQTIKIISNALIGNDDDLSLVYEKTKQKILALEEKLRTPLQRATRTASNATSSLSFESNMREEDHKQAVNRIKEYILEGDAIQVVFSQRLKFDISRDPFDIYRALRTINPSPYMYYLKFGELQVVGSSPEVLVRLEDDQVEVRPIAGTRKRGQNEEEDLMLEKDLLADDKELAEHIMLVDLGRNDIGRVAEINSVEVNESFTIERYSHVMHIVSNVRGILKKGLDCFDVLAAAFPAGTLSGAPKIRAMEIIDELEPTRRGLYGGAVGYISFNGNMDTAIAIRTLLIKGNKAYLGVGGGIVADSVPKSEFEETMNKGRALLKAIEMAEKGWVV